MTLKQVIAEGELKLKTYRDFVDTIELLADNKDDKKTLDFLLKMQKLELDSRIMNVEARLVRARKERVLEFEQQSAECNSKIQYVAEEARCWFGEDPTGVTDRLPALVEKWEMGSVWMDMSQEARNDVYFKLKAHLNFLKTRTK